MITGRIFRDGRLEHERPFDAADVEACRADGALRIWLDVVDPTDRELERLEAVVGLHELSVEDSRRWGQRSKVEFYPGYVFVVVHGIAIDADGELVDSEMHLFAQEPLFLLTIRREPALDLSKAAERAGRGWGPRDEGVGFLLYLLLDEVVDGYLDVVEVLEDQVDDVEDEVFAEAAEAGLQERIFRLKRRTVRFRRAAAPLREVVDLLLEREELVTPALAPYFRDVLDHVIRSVELIDNMRELLTAALEARLAQASNRLNVVMKQLSAWAGIILVPTLIAGIYGMNFRHMPELDWRMGYPLALGTMALSALGLYLIFRRRGWL